MSLDNYKIKRDFFMKYKINFEDVCKNLSITIRGKEYPINPNCPLFTLKQVSILTHISLSTLRQKAYGFCQNDNLGFKFVKDKFGNYFVPRDELVKYFNNLHIVN